MLCLRCRFGSKCHVIQYVMWSHVCAEPNTVPSNINDENMFIMEVLVKCILIIMLYIDGG